MERKDDCSQEEIEEFKELWHKATPQNRQKIRELLSQLLHEREPKETETSMP